MLQRSSARYIVGLYLMDVVLTLCALPVARWLRTVIPIGKALNAEGVSLQWPVFVLAALIWGVILASFGTYAPQRLAHAVDELQTLVGAIAVATLVLAGALYFSYRGISRLLYLYFVLADVLLCSCARLVTRRMLRGKRAARRRVLIVGTGEVALRVARALEPCAWLGIELVGFLRTDSATTEDSTDSQGSGSPRRPGRPEHPEGSGEATAGTSVPPGRILGDLPHISQVVARHAVQEVIVALPMESQGALPRIVSALQDVPVNIKVVPDYAELVFLRATLEQFGDLFLIGLKEPVIGPIDRTVKRALDVVVSVVGMVLLSPLFGAVALLVAASSPGGVLYRSRRVGEGGKLFDMLKFRTMYRDADTRETELVVETASGQLVFDKRQDDPRVTPVGRFLRRWSLDEIPQLVNVLRGDMSLVGPRPELPALVDHYQSWQRKRFSVPQGMTGWWQISGRGNKAKYLHAEDDLYYIQNYTLLLDLRILWRTLGAVVTGEGAF